MIDASIVALLLVPGAFSHSSIPVPAMVHFVKHLVHLKRVPSLTALCAVVVERYLILSALAVSCLSLPRLSKITFILVVQRVRGRGRTYLYMLISPFLE